MIQYLISCKSLTHAQKCARLLEKNGISVNVIKLPQKLSSGGCAYAISLYRRFDEAAEILKKKDMINGRLFRKEGEEYREVLL